jgi:hypothetical protein
MENLNKHGLDLLTRDYMVGIGEIEVDEDNEDNNILDNDFVDADESTRYDKIYFTLSSGDIDTKNNKIYQECSLLYSRNVERIDDYQRFKAHGDLQCVVNELMPINSKLTQLINQANLLKQKTIYFSISNYSIEYNNCDELFGLKCLKISNMDQPIIDIKLYSSSFQEFPTSNEYYKIIIAKTSYYNHVANKIMNEDGYSLCIVEV